MRSNKRESSDILLNGSETDEFARDKVEFQEENLFVWALLYCRISFSSFGFFSRF